MKHAKKLLPLIVAVGVMCSQAAHATFQSASEFNQHGNFERNIKTANPPGQVQRQPDPYRNRDYGNRSERQYYEEVAPENIEEDRTYLLQNHPLQEAPLPQNRI